MYATPRNADSIVGKRRYHDVWMLVNINDQQICYDVAQDSANKVWSAVIHRDRLGTGHTRKTLRKLGWRAKKCVIYA